MNLHYVRAAILSGTGIYLSLEDTLRYLLEEQLITSSKAKRAIFKGYTEFYALAESVKQDDDVSSVLELLNG